VFALFLFFLTQLITSFFVVLAADYFKDKENSIYKKVGNKLRKKIFHK
jgi:hypothetical protein